MEIVGRHHDPFTVMEQFGRPISVGVYSQPVTDITGALLARTLGSGGRVQLAGPSQLSTVCRRRVPACASSGALAGGRDRRGDGLRVLPVPCRARRLPPSHRADAVGAAVLARAVALSRRRLAGSGRLSWRRDAGRDALELLRRLDRGRHHPGRRGCVLARHVPGRRTIDAPTGHHRRESRAHRRLRDGVRVVRRQRRRREPRGLRVPSCRSVPLQREMVELSGSAGRASAARRNRAARLECGGRPRGAARTAGEPRLGNRRARAHRRLSVAGPRSAARRRSRAFRSSSSSPWSHSCARCRRSGRSGRSRSSGLPRFCTTSCRCSGRTRGSGSSCSSWRSLLAGIGVEYLRRAGTRRAQIAVPRPRGTRRRRVRRLAVGAVARRAAHDGAPLGHAAARSRAGPRLHAAQSGIGVRSVADGPSRDVAGSSTSDCTEPNLSQKLAATGYTHLLVRRDTADGQWFARPPCAGRIACRRDISTMDRYSRSRREHLRSIPPR